MKHQHVDFSGAGAGGLVRMDGETRIALLFDMGIGFCRDVVRGIEIYGRRRPHWVFQDAPATVDTLGPLKAWRPHAVIAHLFDRAVADGLAQLEAPVVNTTSTLSDRRFPLVEVDHLAVGQLAAEFFLSRGFTSFGYFGSSWTDFSVMREKGFATTLAKQGRTYSACYEEFLPRLEAHSDWAKVESHVRSWLLELPKPAAVFVSNDTPARHLVKACRHLNLRIPAEVAVLSVDNDEYQCMLSQPTLSSIAIPGIRVGYEAAALARRLMKGLRPRSRMILLPPTRIVPRMTTDAVIHNDHDLQAFTRWINHHFASPISISKICEQIGVGRRTLERKVRKELGCTSLGALQERRLEAAKSLLAESELNLDAIAHRTGFSSSKRLCAVFRQRLDATPTEFRKRCRGDIR